MKRMAEVEIAGKIYPLNFSMKVIRLVSEKFGGVDEMLEAMGSMTEQAQLTTLFWLLALMIEQGAAYKRLFDNEEIVPLTEEQLEVYYDVNNANELYEVLTRAMSTGGETEVKTEAPQKNAVTTQGD